MNRFWKQLLKIFRKMTVHFLLCLKLVSFTSSVLKRVKMVTSHIRRSLPCPKELPMCAGHFLKVRSIPPGGLKPLHNSGFIFYFKAVKFYSPTLNTKRGSQNWVISKPTVQFLWLISDDYTLENFWKSWFPPPFPPSALEHMDTSLQLPGIISRAMAWTGTKSQWVGRRMGWSLNSTQPWNQSKAHQYYTHR